MHNPVPAPPAHTPNPPPPAPAPAPRHPPPPPPPLPAFDSMAAYRLALAQPSTCRGARSRSTHALHFQRPASVLRYVNVIDPAAPIFDMTFFHEKVAPTLRGAYLGEPACLPATCVARIKSWGVGWSQGRQTALAKLEGRAPRPATARPPLARLVHRPGA